MEFVSWVVYDFIRKGQPKYCNTIKSFILKWSFRVFWENIWYTNIKPLIWINKWHKIIICGLPRKMQELVGMLMSSTISSYLPWDSGFWCTTVFYCTKYWSKPERKRNTECCGYTWSNSRAQSLRTSRLCSLQQLQLLHSPVTRN